jgi:hypothetical protein
MFVFGGWTLFRCELQFDGAANQFGFTRSFTACSSLKLAAHLREDSNGNAVVVHVFLSDITKSVRTL